VSKISVPFSPPDITEEEIDAVSNVLRSGWITTGPTTKAFEQDLAQYIGTNRVVCLNSATAAMELTLRLFGIGEGDEVITSAYTYTASASVIDHVGAKIVLCDVMPGTYWIDPTEIEKKLTPRTKAIIPVDIGGAMCDYKPIFEVTEKHKDIFTPKTALQEALGRILILADGAHSLGSTRSGAQSGIVADFTAFSFHAVKNLTTGEGGAVTWRSAEGISDDDIYRQFMLLSLHGQSKDALAKTAAGSWEYDISTLGYKSNMADIMGAIGRVQLKRYPQMLQRRRDVIARYDSALAELDVAPWPHMTSEQQSNGHLYLVDLNGRGLEARNSLIQRMAESGVATNVHYKPLPMLSAYKKMGFNVGDFPVAFSRYQNEITLPLFSAITDEQVGAVISAFTAGLAAVRSG
jgi:dTDP-4-amino-4,6-dideoxygalactose transaminase